MRRSGPPIGCNRPSTTRCWAYCRFVTMLVALLGAAVLAASCGRSETNSRLVVHCGAGMRPPVDEIVQLFERRTGARVEVNYGASNLLLGQLRLRAGGDVFIPGDAFYIDEARADGLTDAGRDIALFVPVILVQPGNPRGIASIDDLAQPGLKLALADDRTAAIGRVTRLIIQKSELPEEAFDANIEFQGVTVHDLATSVTLGHADAAIVWRPIAKAVGIAGEVVEIDSQRNVVSPIAGAVLTGAANRELAEQFLEFLATPEASRIFERHHYDPPA